MQILKDIYLVAGAGYGTLGNVFAIKYESGVVLIDCAPKENSSVIEDNLKYWGLSSLPITHVLLTHAHWDHCGNAAYFQQKGAAIVCAKGDDESLARGGFCDNYPFPAYYYPPCKADKVIDADRSLDIAGLDIM